MYNYIIKKHIFPVMLAIFFITVNIAALSPRIGTGASAPLSGRHIKIQRTARCEADKAADAGREERPVMNLMPEETSDSYDGTKYPQRFKNAETVVTNKLGNGAGGKVITSQSAGRSYWPVFKLTLYPDMLQAARDIILKFLHNKDGMKGQGGCAAVLRNQLMIWRN
jgi:hypothetical protein